MRWRWDQGRLDYFKYDNIVSIAQVLQFLNNIDLRTPSLDPLRVELAVRTDLSLRARSLPRVAKLWASFACSLLATSVENRLVTTDICTRIAEGHGVDFTVDDYLSLFVRRFSYPFPAFKDTTRATSRYFRFALYCGDLSPCLL